MGFVRLTLPARASAFANDFAETLATRRILDVKPRRPKYWLGKAHPQARPVAEGMEAKQH